VEVDMRIAVRAGGALALVAGIVVAVIIGIQLVDQSATASGPEDSYTGPEPIRQMQIVQNREIDDGTGVRSQSAVISIDTLPAAEVPQTKPDAFGVLLSVDADGVIIGTGSIDANLEVTVQKGQEPERQVVLGHDGPELRVVLTPDTALFREDTEMPGRDLGDAVFQSSRVVIQQVVTPVDSIEGLGANVEVQVWGTEQGDVLVADVLVYREIT
jgi:hypothetical protein